MPPRSFLDLQKLAFQQEAELNGESDIPPLTQTLEEIEEEFTRRYFLKVIMDGKIIGSVRGHCEGGTCFWGRLMVAPTYQCQGIGTNLVQQIEGHFSGAERYEIFTGQKSQGNLEMYAKLGYSEFRQEPVTSNLTLVFLEKYPA